MQFGYETNYSWGDSPPNQINYNYTIEQITDYFEIPLWVKYDILKKRFKPYVSVGVSQSLLLNATKKIDLVREDFATGSAISTEDGTVFLGVDDSFQNGFTSLLAGAGMAYDTDSNVRMVVEFTYRETIQNIINPNERYTENELTSVGDVYDDLRLRNVGLSIQFLFPLKYISSQFKSL
jgi:opacity protein-like surface antigen